MCIIRTNQIIAKACQLVLVPVNEVGQGRRRGIRDLNKRKSMFTWIRNQKTETTFLQETFNKPNVFDSWKFHWPGDFVLFAQIKL